MTQTQQPSLGTALVTGASSGIGATYAERLAARGYDLVLVARDATRLGQLAERLRRAHGVVADVLPADLTVADDRARVESVLRTDPSITLLVNNAGIGAQGTILEADLDRVERMIALNVVAPTRLAAAAAAGFVARGRGTIVNIASVLALMPETWNGAYSGTKAYVLNLSQSLAAELGPRGVHVQAVLPGLTRTEFTDFSVLPRSMVMEASALVDAALVGLDRREKVTIPSLPDDADFQALLDARARLYPNLSKDRPAARYTTA